MLELFSPAAVGEMRCGGGTGRLLDATPVVQKGRTATRHSLSVHHRSRASTPAIHCKITVRCKPTNPSPSGRASLVLPCPVLRLSSFAASPQALRLTRPPPVHTEIHGWTVAARGCNFSLLDASTQATASKQTLPLVSLPLALLPKSGIRKLTASYILPSLNTAVQEQAGHQPASSGMHLCTWPLD